MHLSSSKLDLTSSNLHLSCLYLTLTKLSKLKFNWTWAWYRGSLSFLFFYQKYFWIQNCLHSKIFWALIFVWIKKNLDPICLNYFHLIFDFFVTPTIFWNFFFCIFNPVLCDKFCLCPNLNITIKTMQYSGVLTQLKGGNISVNERATCMISCRKLNI